MARQNPDAAEHYENKLFQSSNAPVPIPSPAKREKNDTKFRRVSHAMQPMPFFVFRAPN